MNCDHPGCKCTSKNVEREGRHYCSEECALLGTEQRGPGACQCGHPGCH